MRTNLKSRSDLKTHEGAPAKIINAEAQLRRSVMSCMLFENEFYEDGVEIAERLTQLASAVKPEIVSAIAIQARQDYNLRHAPLLLARVLAKVAGGSIVGDTIAAVIERADELTEFLAMYWKDGKQPLDHQVKRGLRKAFPKFDAYQLAKYDRDDKVKLRDPLRMVHPKPGNPEQSVLWKGVLDRNLPTPDTWETALSGGANKKETFERLLTERKLGYLALLRNLRNMLDANVDEDLIKQALLARKGAHRVLPFRYVAAARAAPRLEAVIDKALASAIDDMDPLPGTTLVLVDVSGSMDVPLSARSDMRRVDAAAALASMIPGDRRVFTFSDRVVEVPARRGMAGVDVILNSQPYQGTQLGEAVRRVSNFPYDRLIVVTDEQSHDRVPDPVAQHAYMINVASNRNGVGYGRWTHIDGFSESVLRYIGEVERVD